MPSVMDYATDQRDRDANSASMASMVFPDAAEHNSPSSVMSLEINQRRRKSMIKRMLKDAGYNELANMVKVTSERV